jgi:predicted nucleotidyltransferase
MYTSKDFSELEKIIKKHVPNLIALYLFGSYANGAAAEQSDIDIAIIVDEKPQWQERHRLLNLLWNEFGERRFRVDIIIKQESDFNKDKELPVTLSHTIATEGKLLWKKAA